MSLTLKERSGYLTKQGKTVKNWRKRWVVLKNNHLHYFKAKDDLTPLDSIPLSECSCSFASFCETKKRYCLKINTPRRTWFFAAETDEDIGLWLDALFMWGVPESREEEEVITAIMDATNSLQAVAVNVVQSSNAGSIDAFRDICRMAALRGDTFTSSVQTITKYNSSVKYSPTPNFNDFLKEVTMLSGSIRDTFLALVTMATDSRDSPNDGELRRKLISASSGISEKIITLKKLLQDESKGIRPQLRAILYGKQRTFATPQSPTPASPPTPTTLRSSGGSATPPSSSPVETVPPISIKQRSSDGYAPPSPTATSVSPPFPQKDQPSRSSSSPRPFSQSLASSLPSISTMDEQATIFDDLITMSKDFVQIMKNLRSTEIEVTALPKSGYVAAMLCVKAARDYANLNQDASSRQAILASAGRVFVATNQLYNPLNNEEEYSTDDLLKALSQSVAAMVTTVLHHRSSSAPTSPTLTGGSIPSPVITPRTMDIQAQHHMDRSNSVGKIELIVNKKPAAVRHGSGSSNSRNGSNETSDIPTLITSTDGDVNL